MNKTKEYHLALMSEIKNKRLERYKLYVEVKDGNKILYRTIDGSGKEQEGIILKDKTHLELNWPLLCNNSLSSFEGADIKTVIFSEAIDNGHIPLSHDQKLRRAGFLCKNFSKNYAYYRAGWDKRITIDKNNFWITINNNFLDIAILEIFKLFDNNKDNKYYWEKIVADKFEYKELMDCLDLDKIKTYRDKFIAHLDNKNIMHIPELPAFLNFAHYLSNDIYNQLDYSQRYNLPDDLKKYYENCFGEALKYYPQVPL